MPHMHWCRMSIDCCDYHEIVSHFALCMQMMHARDITIVLYHVVNHSPQMHRFKPFRASFQSSQIKTYSIHIKLTFAKSLRNA